MLGHTVAHCSSELVYMLYCWVLIIGFRSLNATIRTEKNVRVTPLPGFKYEDFDRAGILTVCIYLKQERLVTEKIVQDSLLSCLYLAFYSTRCQCWQSAAFPIHCFAFRPVLVVILRRLNKIVYMDTFAAMLVLVWDSSYYFVSKWRHWIHGQYCVILPFGINLLWSPS